MSNVRKRKYRNKVQCSICKKLLNSDNTGQHSKTHHKGWKVTFSEVQDVKQTRFDFLRIYSELIIVCCSISRKIVMVNGQETASELYADLKFLNLLMIIKWFLRSRKHCMCSVAFQQLVVALRDHLVP